MDPENVYWLGTISKTRGAAGSIVLKLDNKISERFFEMESVFLEIEGLLVPFFINVAEPLDQKNILLNFDSVKTENQCKDLLGCKVYTEFSDVIIPDKKTSQYNYLIGFTLWDQKYGNVGKITEILFYPDNPVFQIKQDQKEIFVPLHEDLIIEIDSPKKIIKVNLHEGLLDLYE